MYELYPQYDYVELFEYKPSHQITNCLNVSVYCVEQRLNVKIDLICSTNKGDDYEYFLVNGSYFVMNDDKKFKVLKKK